MPRPRLPYLHRQITRHGRVVWYLRIGKGRRIRILEKYGTPDFRAAYDAALRGEKTQPLTSPKPSPGTLSWAVKLYKQSQAWSGLSAATRRQRDCILVKVVNSPAGLEKLTDIRREDIVKARERRKETPAAARHFVDTMRGLFKWAIDAELVKIDPTDGVVVKVPKTDGHPVWTEDDISAFQGHWPLGTRERVAFDLLLYTGLRRGDAVRLGRQHVKDGVIRFRTEKTGEPVAIVICPDLAATLQDGPCGDLTFIAGEKGMPRVKESFGEWFRTACRAVGVSKSAHGLRKAAAVRDASDGYTERELEAKYGWRGGRMAAHYTRSADRERLSINAARRVAGSKP